MRPTIKNKLVGGFSAVLALMGVVAAIGVYSVLSLRTSALETARVGDRLNSISLEIQVHNLEAQRKIKSYLTEFKRLGAEKARETYLDEAEFEIHEIESLAKRGVRIAPTDEKRAKFQLISEAAGNYASALEAVAHGVETNLADGGKTVAAYEGSSGTLKRVGRGWRDGRAGCQPVIPGEYRTRQQALRANCPWRLILGVGDCFGDECRFIQSHPVAGGTPEGSSRKREHGKSANISTPFFRG